MTIEDLRGETLLASELRAGSPNEPDRAHLATMGISVSYEPWVSESRVMDSVAAGFGLTVVDKGFLERNPRPDVAAAPAGYSSRTGTTCGLPDAAARRHVGARPPFRPDCSGAVFARRVAGRACGVAKGRSSGQLTRR